MREREGGSELILTLLEGRTYLIFPLVKLILRPPLPDNYCTVPYQDPFFPHPCKKKNQHSIHYSSSCRGKHLIGDIAMVIVKFCPRWPHTWRYALHSLLSPTTTSGHLGQLYSCSRQRTRCGEVRRDSLNKFRPVFGGELVLFN